jgi:tetratricopeptide (TPR) repeat protein
MADHDLGKSAEAIKYLDSVAAEQGYRNSYAIGVGYARLGEKDKAFKWFERALAEKSFGMQLISYDPMLRSLHGDPRFASLLKRLGLPGPAK